MSVPALRRRSVQRTFAMAAVLGLAVFGDARAQEGCVFGEGGNDVLDQRTIPNGGTITYVTRPHFVCSDGVQIWADSAVAYSLDALSHLIGSVRFQDGSRELTSVEARYFSNLGRLQASGEVVAVDREDGSRVENGELVYLRRTEFRDEETMTVARGADGIRPRATLTPAPPDSAATGGEPSVPYTVIADRIVFQGREYFNSSGDVEIERDSLFAFADSAEYVRDEGHLVLVGSARVERAGYDLVGRTITLGTDPGGTDEIRALREAELTGEDLRVRAQQIRLYIAGGALERLVAVPLADSASQPVDSSAVRPVALTEQFELTGDSLDLTAPGELVDRIFAGGTARSVSHSRDSLNVEDLPDLARQDWLEGDTIIVSLRPAGADAGAPARQEESDGPTYEVEQIVARVGARSLYRLPPEDSTAVAGVDLPAVHYVVGDEITIYMEAGEVSEMKVLGQTRGVHLEPLRRTDDGVVPDSTSLGRDEAELGPDVRRPGGEPLPRVPGGDPPSAGSPPAAMPGGRR